MKDALGHCFDYTGNCYPPSYSNNILSQFVYFSEFVGQYPAGILASCGYSQNLYIVQYPVFHFAMQGILPFIKYSSTPDS